MALDSWAPGHPALGWPVLRAAHFCLHGMFWLWSPALSYLWRHPTPPTTATTTTSHAHIYLFFSKQTHAHAHAHMQTRAKPPLLLPNPPQPTPLRHPPNPPTPRHHRHAARLHRRRQHRPGADLPAGHRLSLGCTAQRVPPAAEHQRWAWQGHICDAALPLPPLRPVLPVPRPQLFIKRTLLTLPPTTTSSHTAAATSALLPRPPALPVPAAAMDVCSLQSAPRPRRPQGSTALASEPPCFRACPLCSATGAHRCRVFHLVCSGK